MKSKRFSVEQIASAIKQHEGGLSIAKISRKMALNIYGFAALLMLTSCFAHLALQLSTLK